MARRRRRQLEKYFEPSVITLRSLTDRLPRPMPSRSSLQDIEDRRQFHPLEFFRPARTVYGGPSSVTVKQPARKFSRMLPFGLSFEAPRKTVICVRRKQRKEVLHALKKVGRGRGGGRKRRNWYSSISC